MSEYGVTITPGTPADAQARVASAFEARNPMKRAGRHEELANLAGFLMADEVSYINGEVVTIDGGEWLQGAGQFNFIGAMMSDADWQALKPKK